MQLKVIDTPLTVCQVTDYSQADLTLPYTFTGRTGTEWSLVCPTAAVPANTTAREDGWRGFGIAGQLDFSLIGILAKIADILAKEGISIFALSTYDTDYVLTKADKFDAALAALRAEGYEVAR